jgi:hypothetical protein
LTVCRPVIELSAQELEFYAEEGGSNPTPQILSISNACPSTLNWQITEDCNWLWVTPSSGQSTGEDDSVAVIVEIDGLTLGQYDCELVVSDPNAENSPQTIDVTLVIGIGAILHVPSQYPTIQAAIDASLNGDAVVIAPGTYSGPGNRDLDFGGKAITVRSIDPNDLGVVAQTIIDCGGSEYEPHRGFKFHSGEGPASVVSGLTITWGYGLYEVGSGPYSAGGAIFVKGSSPTITHCRIIGNFAGYYGGGMYLSNSSAVVADCIIRGNVTHDGGGIWCSGSKSNVEIRNCTIADNSTDMWAGGIGTTGGNLVIDKCMIVRNFAWHGGGARFSSESVSMKDCLIADNSATMGGGGVENSESATISGCRFYGNNGGSTGGGLQNDGIGTLTTIKNCIFYDNVAERGGAIYAKADGSVVRVSNCTFNSNDAIGGGAIKMWLGAHAHVTNCILWGDTASSAEGPEISGTASVSYSDVAGGHAGTGNTDTDPCFVDSARGILNLLPESPCIDAGDPDYVAEPDEVDINGEPRVIDGRVDMGADEFNSAGTLIGTWPFEFEFVAYSGSDDPPPQTLAVFNSGIGTLNWEIGYDCPWLQAIPTSGESAGEIDEVTVSVDTAGLSPGRYNCQVVVHDPCALNSPRTVLVGLAVHGPIIQLSSMNLEFRGTEYGGNPDPQMLTITNVGGGTLRWEIAEDCDWLAVEPNTGTCSRAEADDVALTADISGLPGGTYQCQLAITDANAENSPQMVEIRLFVGSVLVVPWQYPTIQGAIDATIPGDTVVVDQTTYYENVTITNKDITLCSVDPNNPSVVAGTIIDGSSADSVITATDSNALINGFTITNGLGDVGGGIRCGGAGTLRIENCRITGNKTRDGFEIDCWGGTDGGKGAGIYSEGMDLVVRQSVISNNRTGNGSDGPCGDGMCGSGGGGGGLCCRGCSLSLEDCDITGNRTGHGGSARWGGCPGGRGGGIYCSGVEGYIRNCIIADNVTGDGGHAIYPPGGGGGYGGGVYFLYSGEFEMTNCIIAGNVTGVGGADVPSGSGGGICIRESDTNISNCTIASNRIGQDPCMGVGAGIYGTNVTLLNSIVWDNDIVGGTFDITYSDVSGGWPGTGNIDADPCFADAVGGDFHLLDGSPCIDAGHPAYSPAPDETDIDSEPRQMPTSLPQP